MLTNAELAEMRRVTDAATPGPLTAGIPDRHFGNTWVCATDRVIVQCNHNFPEQAEKDAAFFAAARSWVPQLLDEVERLRAENEKLRRERNAKDEYDASCADWSNP